MGYAVLLGLGRNSETGFLSGNMTVLNDMVAPRMEMLVSSRFCARYTWEIVTFVLMTTEKP